MNLRIVQIPVGPLQMNATLVMDKKTKETIFFDPGDETERIIEVAENEGMNITRLIATHCHFDHVADANKAMEKLGLPLEICPLGEELLGKVGPIAAAFGYAPSKIEAGGYLNEGDIVELGMNKFKILLCQISSKNGCRSSLGSKETEKKHIFEFWSILNQNAILKKKSPKLIMTYFEISNVGLWPIIGRKGPLNSPIIFKFHV